MPFGCYEDIEHADVIIFWGNNMAETHPVDIQAILGVLTVQLAYCHYEDLVDAVEGTE